MKISQQTAFPIFLQEGHNSHIEIGLTKREYFAGIIMAQLANSWGVPHEKKAAEDAVKMTDALIAELEKNS